MLCFIMWDERFVIRGELPLVGLELGHVEGRRPHAGSKEAHPGPCCLCMCGRCDMVQPLSPNPTASEAGGASPSWWVPVAGAREVGGRGAQSGVDPTTQCSPFPAHSLRVNQQRRASREWGSDGH